MDCRVWGVAQGRLIEVRVEPEMAFRVLGLPPDRARTTADRVRAAILNCGLLREAPAVAIRLEPGVDSGATWYLDVPIALAALTWAGVIGTGLRWILATGRLGLDGAVHQPGLSERLTLAGAADRLCHTPLLGFEHMFGNEDG